MISLKNKLDINLKIALSKKQFKFFRVIIKCSCMSDKIVKKVEAMHGKVIRHITSINLITASLSSSSILRLIEYAEVKHITFEDYAFLCSSSIISANNAHSLKLLKSTGKGIGIGIIDSGVYPHYDLTYPTNKVIKFLDIINELKYPYDDYGHGTFISGIIAGSGASSNGLYKGVASDSHIYMIKAFDKSGKAFVGDMLYGIETLIKNKNEFNIRVICLPFEILTMDYFVLDCFEKLFITAVNNNIVIVVPAGNSGPLSESMRGIALSKNVITVGGTDSSFQNAPYNLSSAGPNTSLKKPDFAAAANDICSLNSDISYISEKNGRKIYPKRLNSPYTYMSGTSLSAAYVSAICAILFQKKPELKFADIFSFLKLSSKLQNMSSFMQGYGVIDLKKIEL